MSYFGLDRLLRLRQTIKQYGGLKASIYKYWRMDSLRPGTLVGTDKYGNKYYENKAYFYGRNRWVEYAEHVGINYDASQVPAEWYGWLHYKTDYLPSEDPGRPKYKWMLDHTENFSGTKFQYMPYSTTTPKIEAWVPPKK
ncbi:probable NADH dehydrogenase [ubiquinone] 1 alpha subcomplex subunit 12 [Anthonomus grandis grandis]|uniref:probable NADH dehydrogenase [ubiquinone] 1 alpha subcomplex subunit 12 n=1 Tax=Anthonomus grandis grandis TaxID=2921223 RepID=UPI0021652FEF|nr:probable NADH dehydrogenase [ubiquinone] 1 alpha subcomplex subunit 12 [Anthonomus grandis grandis]